MLSLCSGIACLLAVIAIYSKIRTMSADGGDKKLDELKESVYNEFSRNRTEQSRLSQAQREEIARQISDIGKQLDAIKDTNNEQLTKIYREMASGIDKVREKNAEMTEKQNLRIESYLERIRLSNEQKLDEMRTVVDEKLTSTLTERLDSSFKTVSEQLTNLYKALGEMKEMSGGITDHVTTLNRVLTNVKARGTWAEVQLKNVLDQTIPQMYVENYAPSERSKDRVEFAIKIPSGENNTEITYLPLDSKFPMEDYVRLCDAADRADAEELARARRVLEDRVLHEAKEITKYINVPKTTPFAIMYLATEGLYAEIASSRSGILERIQHDLNVMIAGPTTITALLNSLSMGFKIAAINDKANEVRKILSAVKSQYDTFSAVLEKAKRKIDEAGRSLEDAQHRNAIIQKKLKGFEEVSVSESDGILGIESSTAYTTDEYDE